jgi:hypothetical protein
MKSKKINIQFQGKTYELPANSVQTDRWDNTQFIYMNAKNSASLIKQYVKKNFPTIKVWSSSDVYSGGSSVRVNVSNPDGSSLPQNIYSQINSFSQLLKAGRFDGMTDCYEYSDEVIKTDNGTTMKYFPSYIFVENRAPFGVVEYWVNEIKNEGRTLEKEISYMKKGMLPKVQKALSVI